ncbi:MAG: undecaprenyldiphospho-muramoylpentapeptide beta-N-acetylglucosaminyltransferase [Candidatus Omnitrophota bacterium]
MKVILAAGGSGGHIFPSVAVASELRKSNVEEIYFVSSKRQLDRNILKASQFSSFFLSINPMPLKFDPAKMITFAFKLLADVIKSLFIVLKVRPDVIAGFGGYSSGAIVLAGKICGVPLVIHEQNVLPGRANKILAKIVDKVAISFKGSEEYFKSSSDKIFFTGNPLRLDMLSFEKERSYKELNLDPDKFTVLVMGGSQGSSFLNRAASRAALGAAKTFKDGVQFVHITGPKDVEEIKEFYRENNVKAAVFSFMERIDSAYAVSDLAVSRAGAAAVFELAHYARPMILVPYPNPKNNQRVNAAFFSEKGAAILREEKDLEEDSLCAEMTDLIKDREKLGKMSSAAKKIAVPDAGKALAEMIIQLGQKKTDA